MGTFYKDGAADISIEQCEELYSKYGIAVVVTDGQDVTLKND